MIGCGAPHVMREDLAEVRTLATDPRWTGRGVRSALPSQLLCVANDLGLSHVFCLTFEVDFFAWNGFEVLEDTPVEPEVYAQLLRSYDEGVAEFWIWTGSNRTRSATRACCVGTDSATAPRRVAICAWRA